MQVCSGAKKDTVSMYAVKAFRCSVGLLLKRLPDIWVREGRGGKRGKWKGARAGLTSITIQNITGETWLTYRSCGYTFNIQAYVESHHIIFFCTITYLIPSSQPACSPKNKCENWNADCFPMAQSINASKQKRLVKKKQKNPRAFSVSKLINSREITTLHGTTNRVV